MQACMKERSVLSFRSILEDVWCFNQMEFSVVAIDTIENSKSLYTGPLSKEIAAVKIVLSALPVILIVQTILRCRRCLYLSVSYVTGTVGEK